MFIEVIAFSREFRASWKRLTDEEEEQPKEADEVSDTYLGNQSSFGGFGFQRPDIDEPENRWTPGGAY